MKDEPLNVPWRVPAACALLSLIAPALASQDPPGLFSEVIDVRVVNLEVVVTDQDGARVTGLGPEDFRLIVDRREMEVEYFTEIYDGTTVDRDTSAGVRVPAVAADGAVGTSFLVFVDDYFSIARDRNRVVDRLIAELPLLGPEDRMAVVAFDGKKLEMLATWSSSTAELTRVLEEAKERKAFGLKREARLRMPRAPGSVRRFENDYLALRVESELERVTLAATTALRGFAQAPGRRAMLLLAGGWPYSPRDMVGPSYGSLDFQRDLGYGPYLYRSLYDTANRLSYTLYPVDVRGFRVPPGVSVEHRSPGESRAAYETASNRETSENALLSLLAFETGGRAMINRQNQSALARAIDDTRSYYWLGFTPTWRGVDQRHQVEVRTRDPSLKVRTRRSFSDLSRRTEGIMMVESALLFGNPPGPHALRVEVGAAERSRRRIVEVPITLLIPVEAVTFLPYSNGWMCDVELRVALIDKDGYRSNEMPVVPVQLGFEKTPPRQGFGSFKTVLEIRRMKHDVVISIYDKPSGVILWTRLELDPKVRTEK